MTRHSLYSLRRTVSFKTTSSSPIAETGFLPPRLCPMLQPERKSSRWRDKNGICASRLTAQLVAFSAAYDHSCRHAEREFGVTSRAEVDMKGAARELRGFVVIAPGQMARKTPTRFKEHWKLAEQELMTLHWQQDRALRGWEISAGIRGKYLRTRRHRSD